LTAVGSYSLQVKALSNSGVVLGQNQHDFIVKAR
jgi:hypothetical protein